MRQTSNEWESALPEVKPLALPLASCVTLGNLSIPLNFSRPICSFVIVGVENTTVNEVEEIPVSVQFTF